MRYKVNPKRSIILDEYNKAIHVYENVSPPEYLPMWEHIVSIISPDGELDWFSVYEDDELWVGIAYFWLDVGKVSLA